MTGLFGVQPVHAGDHAVTNWDESAKRLDISVFDGEFYLENRDTISIVLSQEGAGDQTISAADQTWAGYFPVNVEAGSSLVKISIPDTASNPSASSSQNMW